MNKAAQALGRLAKGKPKNYSAEEIARRSKILAGINDRKRAKAKKRRMPNVRMSRRPRLRALGTTSGSVGSIRWFAGKQLAANRNEPSKGLCVRSTVARRPGRDGRRNIAQLRANKPAAYPHVRRRRLPANDQAEP